MRLYYEIAVRSFRRASVYRGAYISGMLTNAFFGALISFVYRAIYVAGGTVAGYSVQDAITYNWTTQSLISIGGAWMTMEIANTIGTGEVITDLSRPWNFYSYWLSRTLGERAFNLLLRASLTYLFGMVFFGAGIPGPAQALVFLTALFLAMLVSFSVNFLVNLAGFWLLEAAGFFALVNVVQLLFSGFLLPLAFFPPALRGIAAILPFQAITSIPAQIWLGKISGTGALQAMLLQLVWVVVLAGASQAMLSAAMRKVVIQGG